MILNRSMHPSWLSNAYLLADRPGGKAVLIDTGGPAEPLIQKIEELGVELTHILCTHHHPDHVANNGVFQSRFDAPVCGHVSEKAMFGGLDVELEDGQEIASGDLRIRALHIPGHTVGQLGFHIDGHEVYTGDTLFRRSIGGTRGPGHTTYEDIRHSIMEVLMKLPPGTVVHPGHTDPTTIEQEWEENPFIRAWRGIDPVEERRCTAFGEPAVLLLSAEDYDGGQKCWVRFDEGRKLDIVPGSSVRT